MTEYVPEEMTADPQGPGLLSQGENELEKVCPWMADTCPESDLKLCGFQLID